MSDDEGKIEMDENGVELNAGSIEEGGVAVVVEEEAAPGAAEGAAEDSISAEAPASAPVEGEADDEFRVRTTAARGLRSGKVRSDYLWDACSFLSDNSKLMWGFYAVGAVMMVATFGLAILMFWGGTPTGTPTGGTDEYAELNTALADTIPPEVSASIDSIVLDSASRTIAYMGAYFVMDAFAQSTTDTDAQSTAQETSMRLSECALSTLLDGDNAAAAISAIATAVYASMLSDEDARLYIAMSNISDSYFTTPVADADFWYESCNTLIDMQLGSESSLEMPESSSRKSRMRSSPSIAEVSEDCVVDSTIDVYYINGIDNTENNAKSSSAILQHYLELAMPLQAYKLSHIYNPTDGLWEDLKEVMIQKWNENEPTESPVTLLDVAQFLQSSSILLDDNLEVAPEDLSYFYELPWLEEALDAWADIMATKSEAAPLSSVASKIVSTCRNSISHGRSVVLVAHSQGNLYMNEAYQSLTTEEQSYVGIMSVATPAAFVGVPEVDTPYVTRTDDRVIAFVPSALPGNQENPSDTELFSLNHNFLEKYMYDDNTREMIMSDIIEVVEDLEYPEAVAGSGSLTITLTWGIQDDVDLHVYEPNGTHIYYANKVGPIGFLDVDDVDGEGPENYFISCSKLVSGTYRVGVDYFDGDGPETAELIVNSDSVTRQFTQELSSTSNDSPSNPIMVATIEVTVYSDGSLPPTFVVYADSSPPPASSERVIVSKI